MASIAKQPIDNERPDNGSAAGNGAKDNIKITAVSGTNGSKIQGNKIILDLKNTNIKNEAANDNTEITPSKSNTAEHQNNVSEPIATDDDQEEQPHTKETSPAKKPEDSTSETAQHNQPVTDQTPPPSNTNKEQPTPKTDEKPAPNTGEPTQPSVEKKPPIATPPQENTKLNQTPSNDKTNNQNTSDQNDLGVEGAERKTAPIDKQQMQNDLGVEGAERKTAPIDKQPPNVNTPTTNDELSKTGPHTTSDKTPGTVPPQDQTKAASDMASNKSFGGRIKDNAANKIQGAKQAIKDAPKNAVNSIKNAPKNVINNIKNNLQSDRGRKKQLGLQRRKLESELKKLENKVDGVKGSRAMQIIRFWFPSIYAKVSGLGSGMANAKSEAKMAMLQSKLMTAQTIKATLKTAEATSALIEANIKVLSWIAETIETVIIPILLILIYPILILIIWIIIEFMGAIGAPITKSIKELGKQVDQIIQNLEKLLEPEKKKIKVRKEIQVVNRLMAASKQDRTEHSRQQSEQEQAAIKQRSVTQKNTKPNDSQQDNSQAAA